MEFKNMNKYIYRGYDIIENKNSYGVYGDNDELIRIFHKDEVTLTDVYKHIDMAKMTKRKKQNERFENTTSH
tara:strand:+ start:43 stop:258 length:216 start_codon:yes stop_codon:yes gene_type:complete